MVRMRAETDEPMDRAWQVMYQANELPKAPSVRSPDSAAKSPMSALPGASLMPLLILSNTLPAQPKHSSACLSRNITLALVD